MKRLNFFLIFSLLLMAMSVTALEKYTGMPQPPYMVYGQIEVNHEIVEGVKIGIKNEVTGYTEELVTNEKGFYSTDAMTFKTLSSRRPPVMYGDTIVITVKGDCADDEICEKEFEVYSDGYEDYAVLNFEFENTKFPYLKQTISAILGAIIVLAATILGKKYSWGGRFIGLVKYWAFTRRQPERGLKMLQTALKKEKEGKYK